jgi:hypothetical protein
VLYEEAARRLGAWNKATSRTAVLEAIKWLAGIVGAPAVVSILWKLTVGSCTPGHSWLDQLLTNMGVFDRTCAPPSIQLLGLAAIASAIGVYKYVVALRKETEVSFCRNVLKSSLGYLAVLPHTAALEKVQAAVDLYNRLAPRCVSEQVCRRTSCPCEKFKLWLRFRKARLLRRRDILERGMAKDIAVVNPSVGGSIQVPDLDDVDNESFERYIKTIYTNADRILSFASSATSAGVIILYDENLPAVAGFAIGQAVRLSRALGRRVPLYAARIGTACIETRIGVKGAPVDTCTDVKCGTITLGSPNSALEAPNLGNCNCSGCRSPQSSANNATTASIAAGATSNAGSASATSGNRNQQRNDSSVDSSDEGRGGDREEGENNGGNNSRNPSHVLRVLVLQTLQAPSKISGRDLESLVKACKETNSNNGRQINTIDYIWVKSLPSAKMNQPYPLLTAEEQVATASSAASCAARTARPRGWDNHADCLVLMMPFLGGVAAGYQLAASLSIGKVCHYSLTKHEYVCAKIR